VTHELDALIDQAVALLRQGGVVAYPTDTLYGLGADAFNEAAVERVFEIKGRPLGMPLPLLLASQDDLSRVASRVPPLAWRLAERFWPGALTIVLPKAAQVPALVAARGWTVGLRVPDHPVPRELARRLANPITGTSANISGVEAPATAEVVRRTIGHLVDMVLEGGPPPSGRQSTVVDLAGQRPRLLREGAVSREAIEEACGTALESVAP
jgi:L-threonylcarbamoyladenylate synthase